MNGERTSGTSGIAKWANFGPNISDAEILRSNTKIQLTQWVFRIQSFQVEDANQVGDYFALRPGNCTQSEVFNCWGTASCCDPAATCYEKLHGIAICKRNCKAGAGSPWASSYWDFTDQKRGFDQGGIPHGLKKLGLNNMKKHVVFSNWE